MDHLLNLATFLGQCFLLVYSLLILYLAVMNLRRAKNAGTLTTTAYVICFPILIVGYVVDFLANMIPFSLLFAEPPMEWLVTDRLSRHIHDEGGWRRTLALWFGDNLLDPFDPTGKHLK